VEAFSKNIEEEASSLCVEKEPIVGWDDVEGRLFGWWSIYKNCWSKGGGGRGEKGIGPQSLKNG